MTEKKGATGNREVALKNILNRKPGNNISMQRARLLAAMRTRGYVTTFEAMRYLDVYDPRARIHELRHRYCYPIETIMRIEQTESGVLHCVGVYVLRRRA